MKKNLPAHHIALALAVFLLAGTLLLAASYDLLPLNPRSSRTTPRPPVHITAEPLAFVNKPLSIARTGIVENSSSLSVNADFPCLLTEIYVTPGQRVKTGQPLLKLQPSAAVTHSTESAAPQAQINYDKALEEFTRYQKLYDLGAIPRRQMEAAAARLQEMKDSLNNTNSLRSTGAILQESITINAPLDSTVTTISAVPGQMAQTGQQLLTLGSGQSMEIVVQFNQNELYLIRLGAPALIDTAGQTIAGQVSRIYPHVEGSQVTAFLARIKLAVDPAGLLKSGMSVNVRINTVQSVIVPAVPTASLLQDGQGRNFLYTADNGKAVYRQITPGESIGRFTEIISSLPPQSLVITSGAQNLQNDDVISVIP